MQCKFFALISTLILSLSVSASTYEIRTAPLALYARWATLDFSYAFHKNWAVGPSVIMYASPKVGSMFLPSYSGHAIGGHIYAYFRSFSEVGWYWGNHFYFEEYESYPHNFGGHYKLVGSKFNTKIGYQSFFRPQISLLIGAGVELRSYAQDDIPDNASDRPEFKKQSGIVPFIEVKAGYKF